MKKKQTRNEPKGKRKKGTKEEKKIKIMNGKMNMYGGEGPTGWETPRKGAGKGKDVRSNNQKAKARQYEEAEKMGISAIIPYMTDDKIPTREETIYRAKRMWSLNKTRAKGIVDTELNLTTKERKDMTDNWIQEMKKTETEYVSTEAWNSVKPRRGANNRAASAPSYKYISPKEAEERREERGDPKETWTVNTTKLIEKELERPPDEGAAGFYVTWDEDEMLQLLGKLNEAEQVRVGKNLYIVYMRIPKERLIAAVKTY